MVSWTAVSNEPSGPCLGCRHGRSPRCCRSIRALLYFTDGSLAYAGHYLHEQTHPVHTHAFVEIAVMTGGEGEQCLPRLAASDCSLAM